MKTALCVLALVLVGSAAAAQPAIRVVGFSQLGPYKVDGGTLGAARAAFGRPAQMRTPKGSCQLAWPGLTIGFYTLLHDKQCTPDSAFSDARVTRPWVTDRGLRQGDTVARAHSLYPAARKARPSFARPGSVGLIVRFSPAIGDYGLAAEVANGRVTALVLSDPQGGE